MKDILLGKSPSELKETVLRLGLPAFTAKQLANWLYVKREFCFANMTDISKAGRELLEKECDTGIVRPMEALTSADGTRKYLFPVEGGAVEAVVIPDDDRRTLCVSSQVGCKMGCAFCMTGRQGFHGNLSVAQILSQFLAIEEAPGLTNAVFMGMGEPLDNYTNVSKAIEVLTAAWGFAWSPKRITLSTIGVLPRLKQYLDESRCHLAVSLHNPFPDERLQMMPAQKAWPLEEVIALLHKYDFSGQRRVSFEYTMFGGFNDDKRHADALVRLLSGLECRVNLILLDGLDCRMNLIRFHKIPDFPYQTSPDKVMEAFRDRLNAHGVLCTIRASRGEDIFAACGLLAGRHND